MGETTAADSSPPTHQVSVELLALAVKPNLYDQWLVEMAGQADPKLVLNDEDFQGIELLTPNTFFTAVHAYSQLRFVDPTRAVTELEKAVRLFVVIPAPFPPSQEPLPEDRGFFAIIGAFGVDYPQPQGPFHYRMGPVAGMGFEGRVPTLFEDFFTGLQVMMKLPRWRVYEGDGKKGKDPVKIATVSPIQVEAQLIAAYQPWIAHPYVRADIFLSVGAGALITGEPVFTRAGLRYKKYCEYIDPEAFVQVDGQPVDRNTRGADVDGRVTLRPEAQQALQCQFFKALDRDIQGEFVSSLGVSFLIVDVLILRGTFEMRYRADPEHYPLFSPNGWVPGTFLYIGYKAL